MNSSTYLSPEPALQAVYSAAQIRAHEQAVFATGRDAYELMEQAGAALLKAVQQHWPAARRLAVVVGVGQNAGDGLVVARRAMEAGFSVALYGWVPPAQWSGAAQQAWQALARAVPDCGVRNNPAGLSEADVIVDALFGIGLNRPIEGVAAAWVAAVNAARQLGAGVIAADVPSGLLADTGQVLVPAPDLSQAAAGGTDAGQSVVVQADVTVSFLALKSGLFTGRGPALSGRVMLATLGQALPDAVPAAGLLSGAPPLPEKPRDGHKGTFGTVLVIGGNQGMGGAARMAAESALRVGAGKVILAVHPTQVAGLNSDRPELIVHGVLNAKALSPLLALADALVLGPGLGQDDWARGLASSGLMFPGPLIVDADGLRFLSPDARRDRPTVITPHPAEAARLLSRSTADIQSDRLASAAALRHIYGVTALLKGAGSVLALISETAPGLQICTRGDPVLASAGTGDVLSGVVGGLLALGVAPDDALRRAVCWHAMAGEIEAEARGSWGMAATDLLIPIRALANGRVPAAEMGARLPCRLS